MERYHAKEKQKLVKDKDAGECCTTRSRITMLTCIRPDYSQRSVNKGEPDKDEDGEPRARVAESASPAGYVLNLNLTVFLRTTRSCGSVDSIGELVSVFTIWHIGRQQTTSNMCGGSARRGAFPPLPSSLAHSTKTACKRSCK